MWQKIGSLLEVLQVDELVLRLLPRSRPSQPSYTRLATSHAAQAPSSLKHGQNNTFSATLSIRFSRFFLQNRVRDLSETILGMFLRRFIRAILGYILGRPFF